MFVRIRKMEPADYLGAYNLWESLPGLGLSSADREDAIKSFLNANPDTCFVAQDSGHIVGTILGGSDGRRGYIYHLAVHQNYQRRGLGRQLLEGCLNALSNKGMEKCHIFVISSNIAGMQFWKNAGWLKRGDILVMSKDLK